MSFFAKGDQKSLIQGLIDVMHEFVTEKFREIERGQIFVILRKSFNLWILLKKISWNWKRSNLRYFAEIIQSLNFAKKMHDFAEKNLVKMKRVKSLVFCGNYSILEFCHEMHNFVVKWNGVKSSVFYIRTFHKIVPRCLLINSLPIFCK